MLRRLINKLFRKKAPKTERNKPPKTERNEPQNTELVIVNNLNMDIRRDFRITDIVEQRDGTFRVFAKCKLQGPVYWPIKEITNAAKANISEDWPEWDMSVATNDGTEYRVRELIFKYVAASEAEAQAKLDGVADDLIAAEQPA